MTTVIKTKNSTTTTTAPSSLAQGELAVNITDKKVWVGNAATTPVQLLGTGADGSFTNLAYSGTLTGGTGVVNLGSGQFYKDASGNVGIGVTPSAWSGFSALDIGSGGLGFYSAGIQQNAYYNGTSWAYKTSNPATQYLMSGGLHRWGYAASGTAGANFSFSEAMRIDTSGNVGIGTSSPLGKLTVKGLSGYNITLGAFGTDSRIDATNDNGSGTVDLVVSGNSLKFNTSGSERMRITSSGVLLVGYTSPGTNSAGVVGATGFNTKAGQSGSLGGNMFNINWTGSAALWVDTTNLGNIQLSSDYRIKRNIQTMGDSGLNKVMALRPVTYQMADYGDMFVASDEVREGFIAHEVQEVIPSGAEGQKDEENRIQNLRVDAILAVAVKAIQEQQAIITELKTRIEALESK